MQSEMAVQLAADVLKEHFGGAVEKVGRVLLRRGALSVQEILRFAAEEAEAGEEKLRFPHVRNALLTMVQHGLVAARAHPQAAQNEALRTLLQVYSMDVEEVLARLRFPQFLEHCYWHYGDVACELLAAVLRCGRVAAGSAISEVRRSMRDVTAEELEAELRRLADEGLVRPAEPCAAGAGGSSSSSSAAPACASAAQVPGDSAIPPPPLQNGSARGSAADGGASGGPVVGVLADKDGGRSDGAVVKRGRLGVGEEGDRGSAAGGTLVAASSSSAPPPSTAAAGTSATVYRYNRRVLNLCVCKNLLCRLVEERVNSHASQVLAALLTGVNPVERGDGGVEVEYMQFQKVEKKMLELGAHQAGRDPAREREKLRSILDVLAAHKDGLLKKRSVQMAAPVAAGVLEDDEGRPSKSRRGAPVSSAPQVEHVAEWAVKWEAARRLLVGAATSQLIRDQFGTVGLRIFNLLSDQSPPQRMEEQHILSTCMVPPTEGREVLNEMVRRSVLHWQEVPKSSNTPLAASFWLFYVDPRRLELALLWSVMQAILNLRVRFRVEMARLVPLESRKDSLTKKERNALHQGMRIEDILERSFLVLDAAMLVFRSF